MKIHVLLMFLMLAPGPWARAEKQPAPAETLSKEEPQLVGNLGRTRNIQFAGNHSFATAVLRKSLAKDPSFVLASHSSERLDSFLPVIAERLHVGYLNCGFPAAQVRATHQSGNGEGSILVSIEEGPRYRQGEIVINDVNGIDGRRLVQALEARPEQTSTASLVAAIRAAMAPQAGHLPGALNAGPEGDGNTPDPLAGIKSQLLKDTSSKIADWQPGEPVEFEAGHEPPLVERVRYRLAEQGRPLARFTTSYTLRPGGTADLKIDIADAGPEAQIGKVTVSGAKRNTEDEIRSTAGLEQGEAFLPGKLDAAMLALWRSGRFTPFEIDLHPRGGNSREIDFHIRVCELEKVPPLATPATPEQRCALEFIDWINRGMDGDELLVEMPGPVNGTVTAGWSHQDGMFFRYLTAQSRRGISFSQTAKGVSLVVRDGDTAIPARVDLPMGGVVACGHILPNDESGQMWVSGGLGFSSLSAKNHSLPSLNLLVTPACVYLKENEITREGDTVVLGDLLLLDAGTGRLIGIRGGSVHTAAGGVRALQEALHHEIQNAKTGISVAECVKVLSALTDIKEIPDSVHGYLKRAEDLAHLVDLVGRSAALTPIIDYFHGKERDGKEENFFIPSDSAEFQNSGMFELLVGTGCLSVAEDLLPDAKWASLFSRELLFIAGGRTEHTGTVMDGLLADPAIGPLSCVLCSQLLESLDPSLARRFLTKAAEQSSAEAFRHDWQMFLGSKTALGESIDRIVASLATFRPEQEAEAAALLPTELATWLHGFLEALRHRPADHPLADWIAPGMDRLWDDHLGAALRRALDEKLGPPADPKELAATVNGAPVSRAFVRALRDQNLSTLRGFPLPAIDERRPWTRDPALAAAIRSTFIMEELRRNGGRPPDEQTQAELNGQFPDLADKDDPDWVRETGMNRQQLRNLALAFGSAQAFLQEIAATVPEPEEAVLRDHFKAHSRLFRSKFSTDLVFIQPSNPSPRERARCHRLAAAIASLTGKGLPMGIIQPIAEEDLTSPCAIYSQIDATVDSLQAPLVLALEGLENGGRSSSLELSNGIGVVVLKSRTEDPAIKFEQVKEVVAAQWKGQQVEALAERWFAAREAAADIRVVGDVDAPDESTAFDELLAEQPASLVGMLGDFWTTIGTGDKALTEAKFSQLLGAGWKNAGELAILVEALASQKQPDLALRCLQKAADADPLMARQVMDASVNRHPNCELGNQLKELRDRIAPAK